MGPPWLLHADCEVHKSNQCAPDVASAAQVFGDEGLGPFIFTWFSALAGTWLIIEPLEVRHARSLSKQAAGKQESIESNFCAKKQKQAKVDDY